MELRRATSADVPGLCAVEHNPAYRRYISNWPEAQHVRNLSDADYHYTVAISPRGDVAGFAILRGLQSPHRSLELTRLAVAAPGGGLGRELLKNAAGLAFETHNAHRLWLDLWAGNDHARHVYERFGFRLEGELRESELLDGEFRTMLLMAMLRREYFARSTAV